MCRGGLGDRIEQALSAVGITRSRVEHWLNRPCGCEERKERLNQLGSWATRVIRGKLDYAEHFLERILS